MPISVEELEEAAAVNSEIRFITIELMKISTRTGKSFKQVLDEFRQNAYNVKSFLAAPPSFGRNRQRR